MINYNKAKNQPGYPPAARGLRSLLYVGKDIEGVYHISYWGNNSCGIKLHTNEREPLELDKVTCRGCISCLDKFIATELRVQEIIAEQAQAFADFTTELLNDIRNETD